MSATAPGELDRFRVLVRQRLGLEYEESRLADLARVMTARMAATGAPDVASYAGLAAEPGEWRALVDQLTVGETYFFRNPDHFRALAEHVLPERARLAAAAGRRLRVLSLGCATGEEPYSVAITIREHLPALDPSAVELVGVDVNAGALARAAAGSYSPWALRATPPDVLKRWFEPQGRGHTLDPRVRAMVTFVEHNLADTPASWWSGPWDVVLCRNVLMYLTPALMTAVIERIGRSLGDGGYLFLGHAETLRGRSDGFRLCHTHDTFYYQRGESHEDAVSSGVLWIDEIDRSARRIAELSGLPDALPADRPELPPAPPAAPPPVDLGPIRALFAQERLDDAAAALDALPPTAAALPEIRVLRAGAHYLGALRCENDGDAEAARGHDLAALTLEPGFAMARLHLGLLARRGGDAEGARRYLRAALTLIEREPDDRIALFGGGFNRAALLTLCRAELRAAGDPA
jgi:chemotaxis protein methyltransferase CheR